MKKLLAGLLIGALVALPTASLGSHINEPTAPITGLRLHLENYALNLPVDCTGVEPYGFDKLRVAMYVDSAAPPSEHFTAGFTSFFRVIAKGQERWIREDDSSWPHQNVPPHTELGKFDASRLSDMLNLFDHPGWWRVTATIRGDESGTVLVDSCTFRVELGG